MSEKGYGELSPIISESIINAAKTQEEKEILHTKNRRVEIKILAL
ncbi:hypothetical protein [Brumimicrobium aurantiacum]|nr:hypothetical protein [Brumimicrobium aurantiacum]